MSLPTQGLRRLPGVFALATAVFCALEARAFAQASLLDPTFNTGTDAEGIVYSLIVQEDGKIIVGGRFTRLAGQARTNLARLNPDGQLDASFPQGTDGPVYQLLKQSDGKILLVGDFTNLQGVARQRVGRLLTNGVVDGSFDVGTNVPVEIVRLVLAHQPDGNVLVGRGYAYNEVSAFFLKRFNPDGQLDPTFVQTSAFTNGLTAICVRTNGSILLGGYFPQLSNTSPVFLTLLHTNGQVDTSFASSVGKKSSPVGPEGVSTIEELPDGSVLICGQFSKVGSTNTVSIAKLTASLGYDSDFQPDKIGHPEDVTGTFVNACLRLPDGKLVLGGTFWLTGPPVPAEEYDRFRLNLVRLDPNGKVDPCFDPGLVIGGLPWNGAVTCLVLQSDGKFIAGGAFNCYSGSPVERATSVSLARFLPHGDCNATRVHLLRWSNYGSSQPSSSYSLVGTCAPGGANHLQVSTNLVDWADWDAAPYDLAPFLFLQSVFPGDIQRSPGAQFFRIRKAY